MKTAIVIFAIIFANTAPSLGRNIEAYYSSEQLVEKKSKLDSLYGKFERIDYYAGKTSIDDGFGGTWNIKNIVHSNEFAPEYVLWRPSNRFLPNRDSILYGGIQPGGAIERRLRLAKHSTPLLQSVEAAFWGYIKGVSQMGGLVSFFLWVDPESGFIKEVAFMFQGMPDTGVNMGAAIPSRNYTIFEEILKKTVFFDMTDMEFTENDIESNYCYYYTMDFRKISKDLHLYPNYPDSLDFLKGHYPPEYYYIILGSYPY